MNTVYVDSSRYQKLPLQATVKLKDRRTGEVATKDVNGTTITKQEIVFFMIDRLTGESGVIKVTILADETPVITPGEPVEIDGLRAMYWEIGGKSGLSYSADGIRPVTAREQKAG